MLRVTKLGGHLVLSDWRYGRIGSQEFKALDTKRVSRFFGVGSQTKVCTVFRGALVPLVGRFLSQSFSLAVFFDSELAAFCGRASHYGPNEYRTLSNHNFDSNC
jgi:hypothetical protein